MPNTPRQLVPALGLPSIVVFGLSQTAPALVVSTFGLIDMTSHGTAPRSRRRSLESRDLARRHHRRLLIPGLDAVSTLSEEIRDTKRNAPRGLVLTVIIGGAIYFVISRLVQPGDLVRPSCPSSVWKKKVMADQQRDVIEVLTQDHREVERMFAELESLTGSDDRARRQDGVDQVTIELVKHMVAEEAEVYPAVRSKAGDAEAQRGMGEHAEAEETMKRLENLATGDPQFDTELATLIRQIREHVAEEEGRMFAEMRRVFSPEELIELGAKVEAAKKLAPTRPHPSTPHTPPGEKIPGPITGLLDRMRDAVTGRGHSGAAGSPTR